MIDENLIKQFLDGEWFYSEKNHTLKKSFGKGQQLKSFGLIDHEGYLDKTLKTNLRKALEPLITDKIVGPFGDADIFSGDLSEDETIYNIELFNVTPDTISTLKTIAEVTIIDIDKK